jgi:hypothetical protein
VTVGDAVQWVNSPGASVHTTTVFATPTDPFAFDIDPINDATTTPQVTMSTVGTYTVICKIHGSMRQQLVVEASPPPDVPEVPLPALLGASALAAFGVVVLRRRRAAPSAASVD